MIGSPSTPTPPVPDHVLLPIINQMSTKLASISNPDQIHIDLMGFTTALQSYLHQSGTEQNMLITLMKAQHTQDVTYIQYLKAQVGFEQSKGKVRGQQVEVWKSHYTAAQMEIAKLREELDTFKGPHLVNPNIYLSPPPAQTDVVL